MKRRANGPTSVLLIGTLLAVGIGLLAAQPAGAACAAPTILVAPTEVGRGQQVQVTGLNWATECNDVNPSPEDRSGPPVPSVELAIIQNDVDSVVGTATPREEDYGFSTTVAVPADLAPGPAQLVARAAADPAVTYDTSAALTITDDDPVEPPAAAAETPPTSGPVGAAAPDVGSVVDDGNSSLPLILGGVGIVLAVVIVGGFVLRSRSAQP